MDRFGYVEPAPVVELVTCVPCHGRGTRDGKTECEACAGYGVIEVEAGEEQGEEQDA